MNKQLQCIDFSDVKNEDSHDSVINDKILKEMGN
jgi:hypothetical protein